MLATALLASACSSGGGTELSGGTQPLCYQPSESLVLLAQTVQDSSRLPCINGYPAGWRFDGYDVRDGSATYWLSSSIAGYRVVEVQLLPACERSGDRFTVGGTTGVAGYLTTDPGGETRRFVFEGGCVTERIALPEGTDEIVVEQARGILGFLSREALAASLERDYDVTLCGAGADPCIG
jgi:hypothetical protein